MKNNNKGFSLVELIIVIAIIAILAAALTPQMMKYIDKANIAHDMNTCDAISDIVNATLAEEEFYQILARNGNNFTDEIILYYTPDDVYFCTYNGYFRDDQEFYDMVDFVLAIDEGLGYDLDAPRQAGKNGYSIRIKVKAELETSPSGETNQVYSVGNVYVNTLTWSSENMSDYFCSLGFDEETIW